MTPSARKTVSIRTAALWAAAAVIAALAAGFAPGPLGPSRAEAAERCIVMRPAEGRDVLFNLCDVCRKVKMEHRRPGSSFPANRDYVVPAHGRAQMPLRRGGGSRIQSEEACPGAAAAAGSSSQPTSNPAQCIVFQKTPSLGPVAVNTCTECRVAEIERTATDGSLSSLSIMVDQRSYVPIKADGATGVRLIGESACR